MEKLANYLFHHDSNAHGHHGNAHGHHGNHEFLSDPISLTKIPCETGVLDICLLGKEKVGICSYLKEELNIYETSGTPHDALPTTGKPQYLSSSEGSIVYTKLDGHTVFKTEFPPSEKRDGKDVEMASERGNVKEPKNKEGNTTASDKDSKDVEMASEKGNIKESKKKEGNPTHATASDKNSKASKKQSKRNPNVKHEEKMEVDKENKKTGISGRKANGGANERNRKTSDIFITTEEWIPRGIHCTKTGDLIVCLWNGLRGERSQGKVVKYSEDGEVMQKYETHHHKHLYARPMYVTENGHGDICVSDWERKSVIVVNRSGTKKFEYEGHKMQNDEEQKFDPRGLCTDSLNNIIIADYWCHRLHALDENGHFIRFLIYENARGPTGICIDENNVLYVSELGGKSINVIKYLKEPVKPE